MTKTYNDIEAVTQLLAEVSASQLNFIYIHIRLIKYKSYKDVGASLKKYIYNKLIK